MKEKKLSREELIEWLDDFFLEWRGRPKSALYKKGLAMSAYEQIKSLLENYDPDMQADMIVEYRDGTKVGHKPPIPEEKLDEFVDKYADLLNEEECPTCDGRGFCLTCDGYGYVKLQPKTECPDCSGSGSCRDCDGSGKIKKEE